MKTWLFQPGFARLGIGEAEVPTEVWRTPAAGNGGGQETLYSRVEWSIHPVGHRWIGTAPDGGPEYGDGATANTLWHPDSWSRVFPERKQIKFARLVTRES